jgi:hypothetical protein
LNGEILAMASLHPILQHWDELDAVELPGGWHVTIPRFGKPPWNYFVRKDETKGRTTYSIWKCTSRDLDIQIKSFCAEVSSLGEAVRFMLHPTDQLVPFYEISSCSTYDYRIYPEDLENERS